MTTQEAKMKNDIPRNERNNVYHELYYPNLRFDMFNLLSGNIDYANTIMKDVPTSYSMLTDAYAETKQDNELTTDIPIQFTFTDDGMNFSVIIKKELEDADDKIVDIYECVYLSLKWTEDNELLTFIAKALSELVLQCTRGIPKLFLNRQNFRTVTLIESNPIYEQMAFVFAMHIKLKLQDSLPKCYIQCLMSRKRVTYNQLCHNLRFCTTMPETLKGWFENEKLVEEQVIRQFKPQEEQNNTETPVADEDQPKQWVLKMIDYSGQKFTQRLNLNVGPRRVFNNDRCIDFDADVSVTG